MTELENCLLEELIKKVDYFRKFRAWGSVFMNQYSWKGATRNKGEFLDNLEKVLAFAETIDLPEEGEPDDYCHSITSALANGAPQDIQEAYDAIHIDIYKSSCLARLIYGGEELRTTPCPKHKGTWGMFRDCICGASGFLPDDSMSPPEEPSREKT